jgi:hypothetical protein
MVETSNPPGISKVKEKVTISAKESINYKILMRLRTFPKRILTNPNFCQKCGC